MGHACILGDANRCVNMRVHAAWRDNRHIWPSPVAPRHPPTQPPCTWVWRRRCCSRTGCQLLLILLLVRKVLRTNAQATTMLTQPPIVGPASLQSKHGVPTIASPSTTYRLIAGGMLQDEEGVALQLDLLPVAKDLHGAGRGPGPIVNPDVGSSRHRHPPLRTDYMPSRQH